MPGSRSFDRRTQLLVAGRPQADTFQVDASALAALISTVFSMNLVLACLNIFPLPPLDGSAAIALLMNESTANRYQQMFWRTRMLS
jgi:Zn-dependent protease